MIDFLKNLFAQADGVTTAAARQDPVRRAAACLMVQAALRDGAFEDSEREEIERSLREHYGMSAAEVAALIDDATAHAEEAVQLYTIAKTLKNGLEYEQREQILEMLWRVAYADGALDAYEDQLIRSVAGLLYVEDRDRGAARKRALASLGIPDA